MLPQTTPPPQTNPEPVGEFYISATQAIIEQARRTLKHGDTFGVFDYHGDIMKTDRSPFGLYYRDTRHLSQMELQLNNRRMLLLSSTVLDDNGMLVADLANPDIFDKDTLLLSREMLHVTRSKFLWDGKCYERITIDNFDQKPHQLRLTFRFAADFADLFEVRGLHRLHRGTQRTEFPSPGSILYRYQGLDEKERITRLDFSPAPTNLTENKATYDFEIGPQKRSVILVTVRCDGNQSHEAEFFFSLRKSRRTLRAATANIGTVSTSNAVMNRILCRSVADLYMLLSDTPDGPYPYAGIPWFSTTFGRDGIITALQTLWMDPSIARGVLRFLARTQAKTEDAESDAEPGKILHEMRHGEMANLHEVPFGFYYGSIDTTPLFILLAGRYFERTGDIKTIKEIWPNVLAGLNWIDNYGDIDKDGFLEYQGRGSKSLVNQGWKDSNDSISYADGELAKGPIALCEVQAYTYAAKCAAASISGAVGDYSRAATLKKQAEDLREHFEAAFWCDDLGTYALALDGEKKQCCVRSSNAGQVLFTGIASQAHAERVAATLMTRDGFSGWGIRTLAASERRYNPMSYHNGSVWPHDNALIALGLAHYGLQRDVTRVFGALFDAAQNMDLLRLPELFCGFRRQSNKGPTLYPVACSPQAWASVVPFTLLESCLGLRCNAATREIRFEKPLLPSFVDEVYLKNLRIGDASVDIALRRHAENVAVNVTRRNGGIRIIVTN